MLQTADDIKILNEKINYSAQFVTRITEELNKTIVGQTVMIERLLIGLLSNGHVLLEGVPGLAKTLAIKSLSQTIHADFSRIQFTPDLLPADVIGTMIYNQGKNEFMVRKGPIFANFVLADEINRAPAKVQSALLEAMQERQSTIGETSYKLPEPFLVLATQNPIEQEGTYPLPEAQLDRFIMQIDISYPPLEAERRMLFSTTGIEEAAPVNAMSANELMQAQRVARTIPVGEQVADAILRVVRGARPGPDASQMVNESVAWGPSPRASQALMLGARAKALIDGRLSPSIEDVAELLEPVFKHRMALNFSARADGKTVGDVIAHLKGLLA